MSYSYTKENPYYGRPRGSASYKIEEVYVERRPSSNSSRGPPRHATPYEKTGQTLGEKSPFVSIPPRSPRISRKSSRVDGNTCGDARGTTQYRTSIAPNINVTDDCDFDTAEESKKRRHMRNKTLLYASVAGITTIAASNNIYQSTKTSMTRRQQVEQGKMCAAEAKRFKNKAIMLDVLSLGVAVIGINNTVNGWKMWERLRQEEKKGGSNIPEKEKKSTRRLR